MSTSVSRGLPRECTPRIATRPAKSGRSTCTHTHAHTHARTHTDPSPCKRCVGVNRGQVHQGTRADRDSGHRGRRDGAASLGNSEWSAPRCGAGAAARAASRAPCIESAVLGRTTMRRSKRPGRPRGQRTRRDGAASLGNGGRSSPRCGGRSGRGGGGRRRARRRGWWRR